MIAVWVAFAVMIYVLEPLVVHAAFRRFAQINKERAFAIAQWLHLAAFVAAVVAISGGILGSHGALPWSNGFYVFGVMHPASGTFLNPRI